MFTGIIETTAKVQQLNVSNSNLDIWLKCSIANELKVDQSVAHNGVCLTVTNIEGDSYKVTAIAETISKTNISNWRVGDTVNIERCLQIGDRLDGHIVQGHVDTTALCVEKSDYNGSFLFRFSYNNKFAPLIIEKGSICVNGTSLTVFNVKNESFCVAIIPYTYEFTNFNTLKVNDSVNLEFDLIGKYIMRSQINRY